MTILDRRASGVLCHLTSLPGQAPCGSLGPGALRFAEALARAGQSLWQILPVHPPDACGSPYHTRSLFAGGLHLVSAEALAAEGWLDGTPPPPPEESGTADPAAAEAISEKALRSAFERIEGHRAPFPAEAFEGFCAREASWLDGYALHEALRRERFGAPWTRWEEPLRRRDARALAEAASRLRAEVRFQRFAQFAFDRQWAALREACRAKGVRLIGDLPFYPALESADVWARPDLFQLDAEGRPLAVAGVPPDAFSEAGQHWGNPLYRWSAHREESFAWWIGRLRLALRRHDAVRLDHFIAFRNHWEIPRGAASAREGRWVEGPGEPLLEAAERALGEMPLVAEDLGVVTPAVEALRDRFRLPGMRVLQFAFDGGADNPHLPHSHPRRTLACTGTHDNDTLQGWFASASERTRSFALRYLGTGGGEIHWEMIRLLLRSQANLAIVPVQDILGLGSEGRMNTPGTAKGNWRWRMRELPDEAAWGRLRELSETYGRAPPSSPGA